MTAKKNPHSTSVQFLKQNTKEVQYFVIRNQFFSDFQAEIPNKDVSFLLCQVGYRISSIVGPKTLN